MKESIERRQKQMNVEMTDKFSRFNHEDTIQDLCFTYDEKYPFWNQRARTQPPDCGTPRVRAAVTAYELLRHVNKHFAAHQKMLKQEIQDPYYSTSDKGKIESWLRINSVTIDTIAMTMFMLKYLIQQGDPDDLRKITPKKRCELFEKRLARIRGTSKIKVSVDFKNTSNEILIDPGKIDLSFLKIIKKYFFPIQDAPAAQGTMPDDRSWGVHYINSYLWLERIGAWRAVEECWQIYLRAYDTLILKDRVYHNTWGVGHYRFNLSKYPPFVVRKKK